MHADERTRFKRTGTDDASTTTTTDARLCPTCRTEVRSITSAGPGDHRLAPCGHRVDHARVDDLPRDPDQGGDGR